MFNERQCVTLASIRGDVSARYKLSFAILSHLPYSRSEITIRILAEDVFGVDAMLEDAHKYIDLTGRIIDAMPRILGLRVDSDITTLERKVGGVNPMEYWIGTAESKLRATRLLKSYLGGIYRMERTIKKRNLNADNGIACQDTTA